VLEITNTNSFTTFGSLNRGFLTANDLIVGCRNVNNVFHHYS